MGRKEDEQEIAWEVKCIRSQKGSGKKLRYEVEWMVGDITWEPASNVGSGWIKEWKIELKNRRGPA